MCERQVNLSRCLFGGGCRCECSHGTSKADWKWLRWSAWWTLKVCGRDTGLQGRERAARIAKGAPETVQTRQTRCRQATVVRVLGCFQLQKPATTGRLDESAADGNQLAAAHGQQTSRWCDRAPNLRLAGGQRGQAKAAKAKAKGRDTARFGGSSGVGGPESPLARDPAFAASVGTYRRLHVQRRCQSNYAIPYHLLKRYAGVRAQQEAAAGSACSGRCGALAVCSSEKRAWTLYKGASGATFSAVQAASLVVQATFGAAKSV